MSLSQRSETCLCGNDRASHLTGDGPCLALGCALKGGEACMAYEDAGGARERDARGIEIHGLRMKAGNLK